MNVVARAIVGLLFALTGAVVGTFLAYPVGAALGGGSPAAIAWAVLSLGLAAFGVALAVRVPLAAVDAESRLDSEPSPAAVRTTRIILMSAGIGGQLWLVSRDLGGFTWLALAGAGVAGLAVVATWSSSSRRAVVASVPLLWIPTLMLIPAFGLGLLLAPAALGVGAAAVIPDRLQLPRGEELVRGILWFVIALLMVAALLVLGPFGMAERGEG